MFSFGRGWLVALLTARGEQCWVVPPYLALPLAAVRCGALRFGVNMRGAHGYVIMSRWCAARCVLATPSAMSCAQPTSPAGPSTALPQRALCTALTPSPRRLSLSPA